MARIRYTNPFAGVLANLAGLQVRATRQGFVIDSDQDAGFNFAGPVVGPRAGEGISGPGGARFDPISDFLLNPLQIGALGETAREFADVSAAPSLADFLRTSGTISDTIREALTTGFRTDVAPIAAEARRQFFGSTVPDIAERFAGTAGISSGDFGRNLTTAAGDLESRLGSLQTELDEAASGRRLAASQFAPNAALITASGPAALAGEFARVEELFRTQEEATRPGARILDFILAAGGTNLGTTAQQEAEGPSTASQIIGANQDPAGIFGGGGVAGAIP